MAKLTRRMTIKIQPISKDNFAVTFTDGTTRSEDGHRTTENDLTSDAFGGGAIPEAIAMRFKTFADSRKSEDPGELFAETKSAKPKMDQKG